MQGKKKGPRRRKFYITIAGIPITYDLRGEVFLIGGTAFPGCAANPAQAGKPVPPEVQLVPKLYLGTAMLAKFNLAGYRDVPKLSLGTREIPPFF